jgi:hypothetical protein
MPIVAKRIIEARAAAAAAAAAQVDQQNATPPPNAANLEDGKTSQSSALPPNGRAKRRGHAVKDENGNWLPTGPGPGWCNPPVHSQYKKGGKGGPGRPKGSVNHDRVMRKHLAQRRNVRVGGKEMKIPAHELIVMAMVKAAAEGKDRDARKYALSEALRLSVDDRNAAAQSASELNASDTLSLAELRREIRDDVLRELGKNQGDEQ